jgi:uncharacterized protein YndB with AHSA1/START domain
MALVDVSTEVVIAAPRATVAAFASDPDRVPDWYVNIKSVEWKTERPARIGSRLGFVVEFLGRRLVYTYEIIELVAGERLVMRTAEGPFPMETTYDWKSESENGTRMTLRNRGTPTGLSILFAPFMSFAVRRANRKDVQLLKRLLETPGQGS